MSRKSLKDRDPWGFFYISGKVLNCLNQLLLIKTGFQSIGMYKFSLMTIHQLNTIHWIYFFWRLFIWARARLVVFPGNGLTTRWLMNTYLIIPLEGFPWNSLVTIVFLSSLNCSLRFHVTAKIVQKLIPDFSCFWSAEHNINRSFHGRLIRTLTWQAVIPRPDLYDSCSHDNIASSVRLNTSTAPSHWEVSISHTFHWSTYIQIYFLDQYVDELTYRQTKICTVEVS